MFSKNEPVTSFAFKRTNIGATAFCFHNSSNNFCNILKKKKKSSKCKEKLRNNLFLLATIKL